MAFCSLPRVFQCQCNAFLDWFTYSDNTIDGQSRKKAYSLFKGGLLDSQGSGSIKIISHQQTLLE